MSAKGKCKKRNKQEKWGKWGKWEKWEKWEKKSKTMTTTPKQKMINNVPKMHYWPLYMYHKHTPDKMLWTYESDN
jgi:hypothetical protein